MAKIDTLHAIVDPIVDSLDATLYDLEYEGGVLRIAVDRPGGIDLETVAEVTRQVSRQLDLDDPISSKYTLEVSSPGLERNLRTRLHWETALGERVRIKLRPNVEGDRRYEGVLTAVSGDRVTVAIDDGERTCDIADIDRARTVFVWGPQAKPGQSKGPNQPKSDRPIEAMSAPADSVNESENS